MTDERRPLTQEEFRNLRPYTKVDLYHAPTKLYFPAFVLPKIVTDKEKYLNANPPKVPVGFLAADFIMRPYDARREELFTLSRNSMGRLKKMANFLQTFIDEARGKGL